MRWFRFYSETLHKRKVRQLPLSLFRDWVLILCMANEGKPRGRLPREEDLRFHLGSSVTRVRGTLEELKRRGLLDEKDGQLVPHNWDERQPAWDDVGERQRRYRSRDSRVPDTPPLHPSHVLEQKKKRTEENRENTETEEEENPNIFRLYEQTIGPFDPHMATKLEEAEKEYSQECIQHSFTEASENNARSWRYVESILKAHKRRGCYTGRWGEPRSGPVALGHDEIHRRHELVGKRCPFCYVPEEEPTEEPAARGE